MSDASATSNGDNLKAKVGRPSRSLDEEIEIQARRLEELREKKRKQEREALDRNAKAIAALLKSEQLDQIPVETWKRALPQVKALLR